MRAYVSMRPDAHTILIIILRHRPPTPHHDDSFCRCLGTTRSPTSRTRRACHVWSLARNSSTLFQCTSSSSRIAGGARDSSTLRWRRTHPATEIATNQTTDQAAQVHRTRLVVEVVTTMAAMTAISVGRGFDSLTRPERRRLPLRTSEMTWV